MASGNGASVAGGSGTAWEAGVGSSAGGATSSATAEEGSSPLPGQIRRFPAEAHTIGRQSTSTTTTSTTREDLVLTSSTGLLSWPGHQGCWQCLPVHPRRAPPPAPLRLPPPLQQWQPVQCPPTLLKPPPLQRQRLRAPCSPVEQGAGAPTAPRAPRQWGLDYDFRPALPLCPIRLRRPPRRAPLAAPPAYQEDYSSARVLVRWALDYSSQDILPSEVWSLRP
jgi:hypothetical protein